VDQLTKTKNRLIETREAFEKPDWYLSARSYNIRLRSNIVRAFAQKPEYERVLDIGCGNGSISLPLLTRNNRLTLLDLSSTMLSIALSRIPEEFLSQVETVNKSFMEAPLELESYDLILCIGVLAYVEDLQSFCAKLESLLTPGGMAIVECTDSTHFVSCLNLTLERLRTLVVPPKVPLCLRSSTIVERTLEKLGLRWQGSYRYALPLPVVRKGFSDAFHYRTIRSVFGDPPANRNSWLGNECIYCFTKKSYRGV
jgi:ubiquinone/menaquinone biosynthesis C-methylase UbiE